MKKLIYVVAIVALFSLSIAPALADVNVNTGLTRDSGGGANPIVKVKWEMLPQLNGLNNADDSTAAGAQFLPSGHYQVGTTIKVCAVVTDPDGVADIDSVYADIFYPVNISTGPNHEPNRLGCGTLVGNEFTLTKLTKTDGYNLFCDTIKNNNNNLPVWSTSTNPVYNYDEVCATDGELMKETAYVYCGEKTLSYEDPSGSYRTLVLAQDKAGLDGTLQNNFTYLDLTAFETDFNAISYGSVKLNTHKIINGDLTWSPLNQGPASVRNIGNTRLSMKVWQNDMGLGKTDTSWNVRYDGRVGSNAVFTSYDPETTTTLKDILNLSELDEMDFSIDISKFPPNHVGGDTYTGTMILSAVKAAHLTCTL